MGLKKEAARKESSSSSSFSDALLLTTMCIIGMPVEVQVKDGSIYSGIFHTASVHSDPFGIVLKKARMIRKGKGHANLSVGAVVDTLVVLSGDLVQVVAKGILLPIDGKTHCMAGDNVESPSCHSELERETKALKSGKSTLERVLNQNEENRHVHGLTNMQFSNGFHAEGQIEIGMRKVVAQSLEAKLEMGNEKTNNESMAKIEEASHGPVLKDRSNERQAGKSKPQREEDASTTCKSNVVHEVPCSSLDIACLPQQESPDGMTEEILSKTFPNGGTCSSIASPLIVSGDRDREMPTSTNFRPSDSSVSNVSTSSTSTVDVNTTPRPSSLAAPTESVPAKGSSCGSNSKEFKLNPEAKTFSPSFTNPRPTSPAMGAISSMGYVMNSSPVVPIGNAQTGIDVSPFVPRPSLPGKYVQYNNLVPANSGNGAQYGSQNSLPVVGHVGNRQQTVRYGSQYQAGSAYAHPNSQTVMVGRLGQFLNLHPFPHDAIQGGTALSQVQGRPLLVPHQAHQPKHQGTAAHALQLCMAPPHLAGGQPPFAVPSHIPFSQPFPAVVHVPVPGGNTVFGSKFH